MPILKILKNYPIDISLKYFKKLCFKDGVLKILRKKSYFSKPSEYRQITKKKNLLY